MKLAFGSQLQSPTAGSQLSSILHHGVYSSTTHTVVPHKPNEQVHETINTCASYSITIEP